MVTSTRELNKIAICSVYIYSRIEKKEEKLIPGSWAEVNHWTHWIDQELLFRKVGGDAKKKLLLDINTMWLCGKRLSTEILPFVYHVVSKF